MASKYWVYISGFFLILIYSCKEKSVAEHHFILSSGYERIEAVNSIADCTSPIGKYTTEVRSAKDGSCYFKQSFGEDDPPFIVNISSSGIGFMVDEEDNILDTLVQADIEMIKGHEVHMMSINPQSYIKNINFEKQVKYPGGAYDLYGGNDNLDHRITFLYDRDKQLIKKFELLNPKDTSQTIEIIMDRWVESDYGELVKELKIIQAEKDTFYFNFESLEIVDQDGSKKVILE